MKKREIISKGYVVFSVCCVAYTAFCLLRLLHYARMPSEDPDNHVWVRRSPWGKVVFCEIKTNGYLHGRYVACPGSGRIEGQYDHGIPVGEWREWTPDGKIKRHVVYSRRIVETNQYGYATQHSVAELIEYYDDKGDIVKQTAHDVD